MLEFLMTPEKALQKAIEICGSEAELARLFGITGQAINQWKVAPAQRVLKIEEATGGQVTRYDLRPDLYGQKAEAA